MTVETEMRWIALWDELSQYEASGVLLLHGDAQTPCSLAEAQAIVQTAVYKERSVSFLKTWYAGKGAVFIEVSSDD